MTSTTAATLPASPSTGAGNTGADARHPLRDQDYQNGKDDTQQDPTDVRHAHAFLQPGVPDKKKMKARRKKTFYFLWKSLVTYKSCERTLRHRGRSCGELPASSSHSRRFFCRPFEQRVRARRAELLLCNKIFFK